MNQQGEYAGRRQYRQQMERDKRSARNRHIAELAAAVLIVAVLAVGGVYLNNVLHGKKATPSPAYKVIVPEGFTVKQTADRFEASTGGRIKAADFIARANAYHPYWFLKNSKNGSEGFLFPKTYEVTSLTKASGAVDMMLKQFREETESLDWSRCAALGITPYQAVIIGSIIEREVKLPSERPVVASVLYNRLAKKMKLGICATVEYSLGHWKPVLTDEDLKVDSPYNTYRIEGLPPGPICSPGFESIRAALYPDRTDYLYYILTSPAEGRHSFTADYQQFAKWKAEQSSK